MSDSREHLCSLLAKAISTPAAEVINFKALRQLLLASLGYSASDNVPQHLGIDSKDDIAIISTDQTKTTSIESLEASFSQSISTHCQNDDETKTVHSVKSDDDLPSAKSADCTDYTVGGVEGTITKTIIIQETDSATLTISSKVSTREGNLTATDQTKKVNKNERFNLTSSDRKPDSEKIESTIEEGFINMDEVSLIKRSSLALIDSLIDISVAIEASKQAENVSKQDTDTNSSSDANNVEISTTGAPNEDKKKLSAERVEWHQQTSKVDSKIDTSINGQTEKLSANEPNYTETGHSSSLLADQSVANAQIIESKAESIELQKSCTQNEAMSLIIDNVKEIPSPSASMCQPENDTFDKNQDEKMESGDLKDDRVPKVIEISSIERNDSVIDTNLAKKASEKSANESKDDIETKTSTSAPPNLDTDSKDQTKTSCIESSVSECFVQLKDELTKIDEEVGFLSETGQGMFTLTIQSPEDICSSIEPASVQLASDYLKGLHDSKVSKSDLQIRKSSKMAETTLKNSPSSKVETQMESFDREPTSKIEGDNVQLESSTKLSEELTNQNLTDDKEHGMITELGKSETETKIDNGSSESTSFKEPKKEEHEKCIEPQKSNIQKEGVNLELDNAKDISSLDTSISPTKTETDDRNQSKGSKDLKHDEEPKLIEKSSSLLEGTAGVTETLGELNNVTKDDVDPKTSIDANNMAIKPTGVSPENEKERSAGSVEGHQQTSKVGSQIDTLVDDRLTKLSTSVPKNTDAEQITTLTEKSKADGHSNESKIECIEPQKSKIQEEGTKSAIDNVKEISSLDTSISQTLSPNNTKVKNKDMKGREEPQLPGRLSMEIIDYFIETVVATEALRKSDEMSREVEKSAKDVMLEKESEASAKKTEVKEVQQMNESDGQTDSSDDIETKIVRTNASSDALTLEQDTNADVEVNNMQQKDISSSEINEHPLVDDMNNISSLGDSSIASKHESQSAHNEAYGQQQLGESDINVNSQILEEQKEPKTVSSEQRFHVKNSSSELIKQQVKESDREKMSDSSDNADISTEKLKGKPEMERSKTPKLSSEKILRKTVKKSESIGDKVVKKSQTPLVSKSQKMIGKTEMTNKIIEITRRNKEQTVVGEARMIQSCGELKCNSLRNFNYCTPYSVSQGDGFDEIKRYLPQAANKTRSKNKTTRSNVKSKPVICECELLGAECKQCRIQKLNQKTIICFCCCSYTKGTDGVTYHTLCQCCGPRTNFKM